MLVCVSLRCPLESRGLPLKQQHFCNDLLENDHLCVCVIVLKHVWVLRVFFFVWWWTEELSIEVWWIWFAKTSFSFPGNNFQSSISTEGLNDVILYHQPDDKKKNRGFCFLEYEDHKTAAQARRRLMSGKVKVWGNVVTVEWADPIEDPDPEVMAKVRCFLLAQCKSSVLCPDMTKVLHHNE